MTNQTTKKVSIHSKESKSGKVHALYLDVTPAVWP